MKPYTVLELTTIILAILGVVYFYHDLASGNFKPIITLYFLLLIVGYFIALNRINSWAKGIFRRAAEKMGCEFQDSGSFALTHTIACEDGEIKVNLRGSYIPASMHLTFHGNFPTQVLGGEDSKSRKFTKRIRRIEDKFGVRVNDAYSDSGIAEAIVTRFPYDADVISELIKEMRSSFRV